MTFLDEIDPDNTNKDLQKLMSCIGKLKEDYSTLIEMRFFDKMSFNEIGEVLGITGNNAKIKLYRAVDKLKKIFHSK